MIRAQQQVVIHSAQPPGQIETPLSMTETRAGVEEIKVRYRLSSRVEHASNGFLWQISVKVEEAILAARRTISGMQAEERARLTTSRVGKEITAGVTASRKTTRAGEAALAAVETTCLVATLARAAPQARRMTPAIETLLHGTTGEGKTTGAAILEAGMTSPARTTTSGATVIAMFGEATTPATVIDKAATIGGTMMMIGGGGNGTKTRLSGPAGALMMVRLLSSRSTRGDRL